MIYGGSESPDSAAVTAKPSIGYGAANGLVAYWPFNASTGGYSAYSNVAQREK
jgi:hypothetical protein